MSVEPIEGGAGRGLPVVAGQGGTGGGAAGLDGGGGFDGLLVENGVMTVLSQPAGVTHGVHDAVGAGAAGEQPVEQIPAACGPGRLVQVHAGEDKGLGDAAVVVGDVGFGPGPHGVGGGVLVAGGPAGPVVEPSGGGGERALPSVFERLAGVGGDQAEGGKGPGTWGVEIGQGGKGGVEHLPGELALGVERGVADGVAQRPEGAAVAVFTAGGFEPATVVAHEVPQPAAGVLGVGEEGEVAVDQRVGTGFGDGV